MFAQLFFFFLFVLDPGWDSVRLFHQEILVSHVASSFNSLQWHGWRQALQYLHPFLFPGIHLLDLEINKLAKVSVVLVIIAGLSHLLIDSLHHHVRPFARSRCLNGF